MTVSGHKSETSIKYYSRTSEAQKEGMSDAISTSIGVEMPTPASPAAPCLPRHGLPNSKLSPKPGPTQSASGEIMEGLLSDS